MGGYIQNRSAGFRLLVYATIAWQHLQVFRADDFTLQSSGR